MATNCPRCSRQIASPDFCSNCGPLIVTQVGSGIPGVLVPTDRTPTYNIDGVRIKTPEEKILERRRYRKTYRIPLLAAVFYLIMSLYLLTNEESNQLVQQPWPFIFACAYYLSFFSYIVVLIMRKQAPMLFFIWSVTVSIMTVVVAVSSMYGFQGLSLSQWIWSILGLFVVSSYWILKYGIHHRVRHW